MKKSNLSFAFVVGCALSVMHSSPVLSDNDAAASMPIVGRIEQIEDADAKLPPRLTRLQKEIPQMDKLHPTMLTGSAEVEGKSVDSFPDESQGHWGGELTITSEFCRPGVKPDLERSVGSAGLVVFNFSDNGGKVDLDPTIIFLAKRQKRVSDCFFGPGELEKIQARFEKEGKPFGPDALLTRTPEIRFTGVNTKKMDGTTLQAELTNHSLRVLSQGVVEEDIVRRIDLHKTDKEYVQYEETILQFQKTSADTQQVRAAKVVYNAAGLMNRKTIIEGTVHSDWKPWADKIGAQLNQPWEIIEAKLGN